MLKRRTQRTLMPKFMRQILPGESSPLSSPEEIAALMENVRESAVTLQHDHERSIAAMSQQVAQIVRQFSLLYPAISTIHRSHVEQSRRNAVLERENLQLAAKLRVTSEELAHHMQRLADCESGIEALRTENASLKEAVDGLESDLAGAGEARDEFEREASAERHKAWQLEEKSQALRAQLAKREAELFDCKHQIAKLLNDHGEAKMTADARLKSVEKLSQSLSEAQAASIKAEGLLIHANNDLAALRGAFRQKEKDTESLCTRYEAKLERLKAESQEVKLANTALQSRVKALEDILKTQRTKADNSSSHIGYLQSVLRKLLAERPDEAARMEEHDLLLALEEEAGPAVAAEEKDPDLEIAGAAESGGSVVRLTAARGKKK